MTQHDRVPLTLIGGLSPTANTRLTDTLRAGDPGTAVVHHDLRHIGSGVVRRRLQLGHRDQLTALELAHGCVSCTLREDLLPLLRRLGRMPEVRRILVRLDPAMEPEPVSWALHHVLVGDRPVLADLRIEAVYSALDHASWFEAATGEDTLAECGLQASAEDERTLAQVALAQVEFADVLVLDGVATDGWSAARTAAVLDRVAPTAPRVELAGADGSTLRAAVPAEARRGELTDQHGALLRGQPPLHTDCGICLFTFTARRPFHPQRLHAAIDVLLDGVVRTRGRAWVASQPDVAFWIESAGGGLGIGHAGGWLAAAEGPEWLEVSPERRTLAALRWDPAFGDRAQELVIVAHQAIPEEIEAALHGALLTDEELAAGEQAWLRYPDPFGSWHEEPCADNELAPGRHDAGAQTGKDDTL
ncbi:ribosome hibernation factor-recruiting GTPase MRF [Amycolatopsis cihanbeyliensis]|uniref:G3E family GTPase n=1 Tax=Amycolatopsis cihanbeyliensis TaxID=1128664 RepID=A0A542DCM7_AMYCI|nr:GTP-binding protein [Amycolatopsis cihanbeyliensis]TQJ00826.1 G3E family GTPase [Amycolatopsis cihanbeyliensis]